MDLRTQSFPVSIFHIYTIPLSNHSHESDNYHSWAIEDKSVPVAAFPLKIKDIIEDHDQGHLYTNLEVPRLTCPGRGSNPGLPRGKRAL